jgi:predicted RNA-binding protein
MQDGVKTLIQGEVARIERHGDGYRLYSLLGEQGFVQGRIVQVDFLETHEVLLEDDAPE